MKATMTFLMMREKQRILHGQEMNREVNPRLKPLVSITRVLMKQPRVTDQVTLEVNRLLGLTGVLVAWKVPKV